MKRQLNVVASCGLLILTLILAFGLASTALATPYFLISSEAQWHNALSLGQVRAVELPEWDFYMHQWNAFLMEGDPYPPTEFLHAELYTWSEPYQFIEGPGLVMVWRDHTGTPGEYSSAWKYDYQLDPDLTNCTINVTVTAPQFDQFGNQITNVSLGIQDINGAVRSWYWNTGPGGPIPWNVPVTVTINTSIMGLAAATPLATGFASNPGFQLVNSLFFIVDESARWVGGPMPIPPPGQQMPGMWNYWHNLIVTPNIPPKDPRPVKWSQPPVEAQPGLRPPVFLGWDEVSNYMWSPIMADDWMCEDNRPVTGFHWWGSFLNWDQPYPPNMPHGFHIGIWTDVPKSADNPFSHPGKLVWETICHEFEWNFAGFDKDPRGLTQNEACFQFSQILRPEEYFYQEPGPNGQNVYWLSIAALYEEQVAFPWGWKTRPHFFNDDAVRIFGVKPQWPPVVGSTWDRGVPVEWPDGVTWDLAFELFTEDVQPDELDWGDAPPPYPTLAAAGGAHHLIKPGFFLGAAVDAEPDGQPHPQALGDDLNGIDDEDGVTFLTPLIPGQPATVSVVAAVPGKLDGWIDFSANGSWSDPGEYVFPGVPLAAGANVLTFIVPPSTAPATTFARFRFSSVGGLPPFGPAPDGEVEDYEVQIGYKWVQWPDLEPTGIDVNATEPYILADDFLCTATGPITDIRIWGSWLHDVLPEQGPHNVIFRLSIHKDIPASQSPTGYSMPGEVLWHREFLPGQFGLHPYAEQIMEGWMDPPERYEFPGDHVCWQYDFHVEEGMFIQQGSPERPVVYWLDVQALVLDQKAKFGWKTSKDHWNDDAVWGQGIEPYMGPWWELRYPPGHQMQGQSIDLAFAIGSQTRPGRLTVMQNHPIADHFWWQGGDPDNEMLSLMVCADPFEGVLWNSITLQASGTGNDATDITAVKVWLDNNNNAQVDPGDTLVGSGVYPVDNGTVTITLTPSPLIPAGGCVPALVSYTMGASGVWNRTYRFDVTGASGTGQASGAAVPVDIVPNPIPSAKKVVGIKPIPIALTKLPPVGTRVLVADKEITADFTQPAMPPPWNWFYIEETNRSAGIGVIQPLSAIPGPLNVGDRVSVLGTTVLMHGGTELMIKADHVIITPHSPEVTPLGMSNRWTGGGAFGMQPAVVDNAIATGLPRLCAGLNNVGSLLRTWGRVTGYGGVTLGGGNWVDVFWMDDGSSLYDGYPTTTGTPSRGIAVALPSGATMPPTGYWAVTGILKAVPNPGGDPVRLLVPRDYAVDMTNYPMPP